MQIEQRMYKIASLDLIQGKYNIIELQNIWDYYIFKKKKYFRINETFISRVDTLCKGTPMCYEYWICIGNV